MILLALGSLWVAGCASAPKGVARDGPVEIRGIDVRPAAPGAVLEIMADGPLTWTAVSDLDGSLILELDDSLILPGLKDLELESGLVESVQIETVDGIRASTKLTVRTRERIDFTPNVFGSTFQMRLLPQGMSHQGALAMEPMLVDEFGHPLDPSGEPIELEMEKQDEESGAALDSPARDIPSQSVAQHPDDSAESQERASLVEITGKPVPPHSRAGRLLDVRLDGFRTVVVETDGIPLYEAFWLDNPLRFVVDLPGVEMQIPAVEHAGNGSPLLRVRTGQFMAAPDFVARLVLELATRSEPQIVTSETGLRLELHEVSTTEVKE